MPSPTVDTAPTLIPPAPGLLDRNLAALGPRSAAAAARIRHAQAPSGLCLQRGADGGLTGTLDGRQLASLRGPKAEGERFAQAVDIAANAAVVVRGFGVGHHIEALARRQKTHGGVIVFEPDAGLLRAVLERWDCTPWLALNNTAIVTDANDPGAIAAATQGMEAFLAAGTALIDHPASKARLGSSGEAFGEAFTGIMRAVRTNIVTTLVQVEVTLTNLLGNLPWYATVPGIADLAGAAKGKPAVVVAAGPSLHRNLDLLAAPGIRDRVVIIAVQTVLKTMLARGIKPHFVTGLDYHEISRRFYEGLTAADTEGVTLIVEPKCNRAILEAFPGVIRCAGDELLDGVLGLGLTRPMGSLPSGATVAHLAYYLARHLGCDPAILIGQDLGFTDGQYYAPGAAIHQVWSSELNEFNTLEMLEWQRIARMGGQLRHTTDQQGKRIYTDEQMATYQVQFERDFLADAGRGLMTIDATEGGTRKQHTRIHTLAEALAEHATGLHQLPATPPPLQGEVLTERLRRVDAQLTDLRQSAGRMAAHARSAATLLEKMQRLAGNAAAVNTLVDQVQAIGQRAAREPAYSLVQWINQTGQFNRFRADRAILIEEGLNGPQRQQREIERDLTNVRWLGDAADRVVEMLADAAARLVRGPVPPRSDAAGHVSPSGRVAAYESNAKTGAAAAQLWCIIPIDHYCNGLGLPRDLSRSMAQGLNPLQIVISRLARCRRVAGVVLVSRDIERTRTLVGRPPPNLRLEYDHALLDTARARSIGIARLWSRWCWRGGLANLTCYDEVIDPPAIAPIMQRRGLDAAAFIGPDWALFDPMLVDAAIDRHLGSPDASDPTFVHAPPGLGPAIVRTGTLAALASANSPLASLGGLLGYLPAAPQADPLAKTGCISVKPIVRDLLVRCIPDSPATAAMLSGALGERLLDATAAEVADALACLPHSIEVITAMVGGAGVEDDMQRWAEDAAAHGRVLTLIEPGGMLGEALELAAQAKARGYVGLHLRTPLVRGIEDAQRLLDSPIHLASIDVLAEREATYAALTGRRCFHAVRDGVTHLLERRTSHGGMPSLWVVPRITRGDAVVEEIEDFYNRGLMTAGACVIDPPVAATPGQRITPLPLPANVLAHRAATTAIAHPVSVVEPVMEPVSVVEPFSRPAADYPSASSKPSPLSTAA